MELKIKFLNWSTGLFGAMLNKKTADSLGIKTVDRISIKTLQKKPKEIFSFVNTIGNLVKDNQIAVSSETKDVLKLKNGQKVKVSFAPTKESTRRNNINNPINKSTAAIIFNPKGILFSTVSPFLTRNGFARKGDRIYFSAPLLR